MTSLQGKKKDDLNNSFAYPHIMQTIKDLINRITWDSKEDPSGYSLFYLDMVTKALIELKFSDIKRVEGNFLVIDKEYGEAEIPMHRIRKVKTGDKTIWERQV